MEEYVGMVKLFAGTYAPQNWAYCNGQLISIDDHMELFTIMGTTYGGDGGSTFGLPDLRNRVPIGAGENSGVLVAMGDKFGKAAIILAINEMATHNHEEYVSSQDSTLTTAATNSSMATPIGQDGKQTLGYIAGDAAITLHPNTLGMAGQGMGHNNMQPSIGLNYIICVKGHYPPRP